MKRSLSYLLIGCSGLVLSCGVLPNPDTSVILLKSGQAPDSVIGQSPQGLSHPTQVLPISSGGVLVVDSFNNRVIGFNSAGSSQVVLGGGGASPADLRSPLSIAASVASGTLGSVATLFIADSANNRVLGYNSWSAGSISPASLVIGQTDLASTASGCGPGQLSAPGAVAVAGNQLVVADTQNHRVLIFTPVPAQAGSSANIVLGLTLPIGCLSTPVGPTSLGRPSGVWTDGTRLVVSDSQFNRVLIWNHFPSFNNQTPDVVLGQPDLVSGGSNSGGQSASTLNGPTGVVSDGTRLYVADTLNHRVLSWSSFPKASGQAADRVFGQLSFTASQTGSGATFSSPAGVDVDSTRLYISDTGNSRVLIYNGH